MLFKKGPKEGDRVLTRDGTEIGIVSRTEGKAFEVRGPGETLRLSRSYIDRREKGDTILNITDSEIDTLAASDGGKTPFMALPAVMLVAAGAVALTQKDRIMSEIKSRRRGVPVVSHTHGAMLHEHEHVHVTHSRRDFGKGVGGWEHLTAAHSHRHNHAPLVHTHRPHRDFESEHGREAHIHDHEQPEGHGDL